MSREDVSSQVTRLLTEPLLRRWIVEGEVMPTVGVVLHQPHPAIVSDFEDRFAGRNIDFGRARRVVAAGAVDDQASGRDPGARLDNLIPGVGARRGWRAQNVHTDGHVVVRVRAYPAATIAG